ncbi:LuxR C-terminal-related transcriptional regulator [Sinomonas halotolerans]|uniref:LuxR C-terminal-related transcriptional regulator n=1 Tax=Sinomonas halotolerans TaxID=1644133 RepID=A0ABU9WV18_9MICC
MKTESALGRTRDLERCLGLLREPGVAGVLIMGEIGAGKSMLLDAAVRELAGEMQALRVHGSPALGKVPFGVLAPFLGALPADEADSRVAVLRAFWREVESLRSGGQGPLLLVIDDAHELDTASSEVIAELIGARWAKAVIASPSGAALPRPLLELWLDGGIERLDLAPLTVQEAAHYLESTLLGRVLPATVRVLWREAGGNPLVLGRLAEEARQAGSLLQHGGTWLLTGELVRAGDGIVGLAREQLARLTPHEREALSLIVVAEPAPLELVERHFSAEVVDALVAKRIVRRPVGPDGLLRLRHPVYGDAMVQLIPLTRSLQLRQFATDYVTQQTTTAEGLLRAVSWALDCGFAMDDATLLRAAQLSVRLFENALAVRAAAAVQGPDARGAAKGILATVAYNRGQYAEAAAMLEPTVDSAGRVRPHLAGCLMWIACRAALGHDPQAIRRDVLALGPAGQEDGAAAEPGVRGAAVEPGVRGADLARGAEARLLGFVADSLTGEYGAFEAWQAGEPERTADAAADPAPLHHGESTGEAPREPSDGPAAAAGPEELTAGIVRASLAAEILVARGEPHRAMAVTAVALTRLEAVRPRDPFVVGMGAARHVAAACAAGEWETVERALEGFLAESNAGLISVGAAAEAGRGLSLIRQGRLRQAWARLAPAVDALNERDPQQVLGLTAALAAYAGARTGRTADALTLLAGSAENGVPTAAFLRPLAELFGAAAACALDAQPTAREALAARVRAAAQAGHRDVALQAELLWFEAGGRDRIPELLAAAQAVRGPWAGQAAELARAFADGEPDALLAAGERLREAGLLLYAGEAFAEASRALDRALRRSEAKAAWEAKCACDAELGEEAAAAAVTEAKSLTRREREIAALAAAGLSDREIADRLIVSVRTVEGHLYRSYAKLGVTRREQLAAAFSALAEDRGLAPEMPHDDGREPEYTPHGAK